MPPKKRLVSPRTRPAPVQSTGKRTHPTDDEMRSVILQGCALGCVCSTLMLTLVLTLAGQRLLGYAIGTALHAPEYTVFHGTLITDDSLPDTTVLHDAARRGHTLWVRVLLYIGVDPNEQAIGMTTPLHVAAREGHAAVARVLLGAGATVDARDAEGYTPLYKTADKGHVKAIQVLLDAGADVNAQTETEYTPKDAARLNHHYKSMKILMEAGGEDGSGYFSSRAA